MKRIAYKWLVAAAAAIVLIGGILMITTRKAEEAKQPVNTQPVKSAALDRLFRIANNHNNDGAFAVEFGNELLRAYEATGPLLFIRDLGSYPQNIIDDAAKFFAGELFLVNREDVIKNLEEMKEQGSWTKGDLYALNKILSDFNSFGVESPANRLREIEGMYKAAKIINVQHFGGHYALIESQRPTFANMYDLYDLSTGSLDMLPTETAFVTLQKIVSPDEFVFMSNGRNSECNWAGFPYMIRCTRGKNGQFTSVCEAVYLPVNQSATFGAKGDEILIGVSVKKNDIRAVFGPKPGNTDFYADFVIVPPARTEYDADKNELIFLFSKSSISGKLLASPMIQAGDNAYVNSITLEQHGENCEIFLSLKKNAKEYTCTLQSTEPNGLGLPCVDIMFR